MPSKNPGSADFNEFQVTEGQPDLLREVGSLDRFYAEAVASVEFAAAAILTDVEQRGFRTVQTKAETKSDGSSVSSADRASHDELVKRLGAISNFKIVSEEDPSGVPDVNSILKEKFFWLADPLDGTRDFLSGEKTFAVSLALMRVSPTGGIFPYFGCICDPSEKTTWWGSRETPLTKQVSGDVVELVERSQASASGLSDRGLRVLGSRSIPSEKMTDLYRFWNVTDVTRMGSALKFALIAEGLFDVYPRFGPTSEWDTAAGLLLLEISGGGLFSLENGDPVRYAKPAWKNHGFVAFGSQDLIDEWLPKVLARESL